MKIIKYFLIILSTASGCSVYESVYQDIPLEIDGSSTDWENPLSSRKSNVSYGISNDKENLYIRLDIDDQDIQRKIFLGGLTIWVDTTGKGKELFGITCPIPANPGKMDRNSMQKMKNEPKFEFDQLREVEFCNYNELLGRYYLKDNPYNVEIAINQDEFKTMYYEMKVPISALYKNSSNIYSGNISIGFETGKIELPDRMQGGMGNRPGGAPGGTGPGQPGGTGGNMPGGIRGGGSIGGSPHGGMPNQSNMAGLATPTKFWIKKIQLTQNLPNTND